MCVEMTRGFRRGGEWQELLPKVRFKFQPEKPTHVSESCLGRRSGEGWQGQDMKADSQGKGDALPLAALCTPVRNREILEPPLPRVVLLNLSISKISPLRYLQHPRTTSASISPVTVFKWTPHKMKLAGTLRGVS